MNLWSSKRQVETLINEVKQMLCDVVTVPPVLSVILVGDHDPSIYYVKKKKELLESLGMKVCVHRFSSDVSQQELKELIGKLNLDSSIHGILLQLPLLGMSSEDSRSILNHIDPKKDVDGLTDENQTALYLDKEGIRPCTPSGILYLLDSQGVSLSGKKVTVIGRSFVVGKPLFQMLSQRGATVTLCHSQTKDLSFHTRSADMVISAAGKPLLSSSDFREDAIVIDVGANYADNGVLRTDVSRDGLQVKVITTPTGSVGPLTVAFLARNLIVCAGIQQGQKIKDLI